MRPRRRPGGAGLFWRCTSAPPLLVSLPRPGVVLPPPGSAEQPRPAGVQRAAAPAATVYGSGIRRRRQRRSAKSARTQRRNSALSFSAAPMSLPPPLLPAPQTDLINLLRSRKRYLAQNGVGQGGPEWGRNFAAECRQSGGSRCNRRDSSERSRRRGQNRSPRAVCPLTEIPRRLRDSSDSPTA